jgi:hypothetical protein
MQPDEAVQSAIEEFELEVLAVNFSLVYLSNSILVFVGHGPVSHY